MDTWPRWSPDGTRIVWHHVAIPGAWQGTGSEIYVMNSDGSNVQRLTNNSFQDDHPCWGPNGQKIIYTSRRGGQEDVWIMNADGSNKRNLTNHPARDFAGDWRWRRPVSNHPPVADAGGPYLAEATGVIADIDPDTLNVRSKGQWVTAYLIPDPDAEATVILNGSASSDPDGDELHYKWTILDEQGHEIASASGPQPPLSLVPGTYTVELVVSDGKAEALDYSVITVEMVDLQQVDPTTISLHGPAAGPPA
jgi:dipeptidyl aminopeptidase/acylaminoacyl peptidase